jgi:acyl dehydratase
MTIEHPLRRTLTEADNVFFSTMTMNTNPLHLDAEFSKATPYGQRLVNSMLTLACVAGMSVNETTLGTTLANLGFDKIVFPNPVFHGDTIRITTEIVDVRESNSRPEAGIVHFRHVARNQRDEIVCDCQRAGLMLKRPADAGMSA